MDNHALMIDATYLKAHKTATSFWGRRAARTPDWSEQGPRLYQFVTAGQVSDYIGARAVLSSLSDVCWLIGDRGYDAEFYREAVKDKGTRACILGQKQRKKPARYNIHRNRIAIMFGRLKDLRRVATRNVRSPKVFLSAIAQAAIVIYWL